MYSITSGRTIEIAFVYVKLVLRASTIRGGMRRGLRQYDSTDNGYTFHGRASARNYVKVHQTTLPAKIKISLSQLRIITLQCRQRCRVIKHEISKRREAFQRTPILSLCHHFFQKFYCNLPQLTLSFHFSKCLN